MPVTIPTERVDFSSRGIRCAAWLTLPAGPGPHPAVVLAHGLGATHDIMLAQYEQHFAAAGIAMLAFDYRNTGASDGRSRQHISTREQCVDVAAAHRAPRGVATHYDSDHFAIYHPPLVTAVLADQTAFLQEHFGVDA